MKRDHGIIGTTGKISDKVKKKIIEKAQTEPMKRAGNACVVKDTNGREAEVTENILPKNASGICHWTFKVGSRQKLYDQFLDIYPDLAGTCWGFDPFNWDNDRRSILIRLNEDKDQLGTRILFEVSRGIGEDRSWSQFRTMLIPYSGFKKTDDTEVYKK